MSIHYQERCGHEWREELRLIEENRTVIYLFCSGCKGRKKQTIPSKAMVRTGPS